MSSSFFFVKCTLMDVVDIDALGMVLSQVSTACVRLIRRMAFADAPDWALLISYSADDPPILRIARVCVQCLCATGTDHASTRAEHPTAPVPLYCPVAAPTPNGDHC
jgi:hypothetical protein